MYGFGNTLPFNTNNLELVRLSDIQPSASLDSPDASSVSNAPAVQINGIHHRLSMSSVNGNANGNGAENHDVGSSSAGHRHRRPSNYSTHGDGTGAGGVYCPNCGFLVSVDEQGSYGSSRNYGMGVGMGRTGMGEFKRRDYFKLLGRLESGSEANKELINSIFHAAPNLAGSSSNEVSLSPSSKRYASSPITDDINGSITVGGAGGGSGGGSEFGYLPSGIPIELINQGYFDKFFKVLKVLGNGSNGIVMKVEHELFGLNLGVFALKKIAIGNDMDNLIRILDEVKFLYSLSENADLDIGGHTNIVKYNHVWLEVDHISEFGPKVPVVFILFEYCDGGTLEEFVENIANPKFDLKLERLLRRWKRLNPDEQSSSATGPPSRPIKRYLNNYEIFKIFNDAVRGLQCLHSSKIIHRDLKPSNCLFKSKFPSDYTPINSTSSFKRIPTLLVSDFGESIVENTKRNSTGATGTLEFCAPELFQLESDGRLKEFSYASDIYSLGLILYYLCFNKLPFKSQGPKLIRNEISQFEFLQDFEKIRNISNDASSKDTLFPEWIEMIKQMTSYDPLKRPTTEQILSVMPDIYQKLNQVEPIPTEPPSGAMSPDLGSSSENLDFAVDDDEDKEMGGNDDAGAHVLDVDWDYRLLVIAVLGSINLVYRDYPLLSNLQFMVIGASVSSMVRSYVIVIELCIFIFHLAFS
ncbi:unnamed protein product [Ambrosiozyma monospora]|uniref:Unnamed protein product n=1 Tax=Ambrosiozyma monospora TaxID=43982 RepID=A0A9W7DI68_AMBMO|nr:unnamed protein product [Ambrosiozyma monospora]